VSGCSAFAKPSDGLEPSTPSLPWHPRGNRSQPTATVCPFEPFLRPQHLPPVATGCDRSAPLMLHPAPRPSSREHADQFATTGFGRKNARAGERTAICNSADGFVTLRTVCGDCTPVLPVEAVYGQDRLPGCEIAWLAEAIRAILS
jgi:hypothetical protein